MKQLLFPFGILLLLSAFCNNTFSQTSTVRGFIYEEETGEPVIFTSIFLKGTTFDASTDVNGYYSIPKVPSGTYTLMVANLSFDTLEAPISLRPNQVLNKKLIVKKGSVKFKICNISSEAQEARNEVKASVQKITSKDIAKFQSGERFPGQYLNIRSCYGSIFITEETRPTCPVLEQDKPENWQKK